MMWGSLLTTGGGLVFGGGTNDRQFRAYDAKSGEELWHFRTNSGIIAPPSTFEVNGVQYIAVQSGYGVDPAFQQGLMAELVGWQKDVPQGGVVWVFAVSSECLRPSLSTFVELAARWRLASSIQLRFLLIGSLSECFSCDAAEQIRSSRGFAHYCLAVLMIAAGLAFVTTAPAAARNRPLTQSR